MRLTLAFVVTIALAACGGGDTPSDGARLVVETDDGAVTLAVEVADTSLERATGLMGRERLSADAGMVFLWQELTGGSFWMKDTLIPLSIAFWDERDRIVAILDMEPCTADPCPSYDPGLEYAGAVEVNQGFFDGHGVEVGDLVELRVGP